MLDNITAGLGLLLQPAPLMWLVVGVTVGFVVGVLPGLSSSNTAALLLPFAIYLPFLYYQARFRFDPGPLAALSIGLTTIGMMFVAIGLFFSALTRNQIIAAIWTFVTLFLLVLLTLLGYSYAIERQAAWADAVRFVAVLYQVQSFGTGQLDLRFIALHLSVAAFMLYATVKVLESRRYK